MFPIINIFGKEISVYAVLALIGILICGTIAVKQAKKTHIEDYNMMTFLLFCGLGGFLGSHLLYGITNLPIIIKVMNNLSIITSFEYAVQLFILIFGGAVFYGGLIGGLAVGFAYLKITKKNSFDYFVIVTPLIPLFHAFGRLGCFFGGCCYGIESNFGFIFTNSLIESANGVRRFPVQLLEMAVLLVLFVVFFIMYKKKFLKKLLLPLYLISYGVCRFFIEFLRGDEYRGFVFNMSTSQFISVIIVAICLVAIAIKWYQFKQKRVVEN